MTFVIPTSIKAEHHKLHQDLHNAMSVGGRTGEAARRVAAVLAPHFEKEEAYAMPQLGLLAPLADDEAVPNAEAILGLSERLRSELPSMLNEHRQIRAALAPLVAAARSENRHDIADFAERLALHATHEEEVLYPAALLVGRYLEMKRRAGNE